MFRIHALPDAAFSSQPDLTIHILVLGIQVARPLVGNLRAFEGLRQRLFLASYPDV